MVSVFPQTLTFSEGAGGARLQIQNLKAQYSQPMPKGHFYGQTTD